MYELFNLYKLKTTQFSDTIIIISNVFNNILFVFDFEVLNHNLTLNILYISYNIF